jgi:adenosine deaminase
MASTFQEALIAQDIEAIRRYPKADLHMHCAGGGNRAFIRARTGRDIAPVAAPLDSMDAMHAWFAAHIGEMFKGAGGMLFSMEAALEQAKADGISRIDLGFDIWAITQGFASAWEILEQQTACHRATAPDVEWLSQLSMSRHCGIAALDRWLSPFLELGAYKTFDLSGDELGQPIERFVSLYAKANAAGLRLKAHVGEWGTADDVWRAVELLELDEVQHGIAAADSRAVMRFLADNRVRLNICPTSNLLLRRVESLAVHPIRKLFDAGVIVTVNSDDALIFGNGVSEEFLALFRAGVFNAAELDSIRLNGLSD